MWKVLTLDQLKRGGRIFANRCFFAFKKKKKTNSIDYLLIHCRLGSYESYSSLFLEYLGSFLDAMRPYLVEMVLVG